MARGSRTLLIALTVAAASVFLFSSAAGAQDNNDGSTAYVGAETVSRTPTLTPAPAAAAASTSATPQVESSSLAFTGSDMVILVLAGGMAVVAGVALMAARRRAPAQAA